MSNKEKEYENKHWLDQIYSDFEKNGGMKNNPYHGKPLPKDLFSGSVYDNFLKTAKEAGYLPYWIEIQNDIKKLLLTIRDNIEQTKKNGTEINDLLKEVNKKIKKYNEVCPPSMQRMKLDWDDFKEKFESWF